MDYIVVNWEIDGDTKDYESKEVQGEERHSTFVVSVRIFCINNTQGRNCNETKGDLVQVLFFSSSPCISLKPSTLDLVMSGFV